MNHGAPSLPKSCIVTVELSEVPHQRTRRQAQKGGQVVRTGNSALTEERVSLWVGRRAAHQPVREVALWMSSEMAGRPTWWVGLPHRK